MKYLANWQPLLNEDRHTALLFGFMRHAPLASALNPWLSSVLDRPVEAASLSHGAFWPTFPSRVPGSLFTQPELVFDVHDGAPLTVVVEVKPGFSMQLLDQISREVIDTAAERGVGRVACIMVGADSSFPMNLSEWETEVIRRVSESLPAQEVEVELAYASFASLGEATKKCAAAVPEWAMYAEDVCAQLQRKGLLGYTGAPMLDDLEGLTVPSGVESFNRAIRAARDFLLHLHGQAKFADLELAPYGPNAYRMIRNGGSVTLTQLVEWFETTVAMCLYRREEWDPQRAIFVCFDLLGSSGLEADLCVGACEVTGDFTYGFARAERKQELLHPVLGEASLTLPETKSGADGHWRFARRPWVPGQADEDIDWALSLLDEAAELWMSDAAKFHGGHADFALVSTATLRKWLVWWSDPQRTTDGQEEAGRDPALEVAKLTDELVARDAALDGPRPSA